MMHLSEDTCPYICLGRCAQTTLYNTVTIKGHWWSHDISGDLSCDLLSRVGCYKSNTFWGEALSTFVYVRNRLPTASLPSNKTPYEVAFGKKPSLQHLRVFGCRAYVMIQKDQRKSLQPHSMACIFLGYSEEIKGWRCYDLVSKNIIVSSLFSLVLLSLSHWTRITKWYF